MVVDESRTKNVSVDLSRIRHSVGSNEALVKSFLKAIQNVPSLPFLLITTNSKTVSLFTNMHPKLSLLSRFVYYIAGTALQVP